MISVNDLINTVYIPYNEHAGYIMGSWGQVHTASAQASATREQTKKWGSRWIGKRCWDCSGLIYWAFHLYDTDIYHGSNTMWNQYCTAKGELYQGERDDNEPLKLGTAVFLNSNGNRHHVGVYVGNGKVIEAKGTYYGVVMSDITHWDEWGELKGVDYTSKVVLNLDALRIGMKSDDVKSLQTMLNNHGYSCVVDGIFGSETKSAVVKYQQDNGLIVDGIVGNETMSALKNSGKQNATYNLSEAIQYIAKGLAMLNELNGGTVG